MVVEKQVTVKSSMGGRLSSFVVLCTFIVASCAGNPGPGTRLNLAMDLANDAQLHRRIITTRDFDISVFSKFSATEEPAIVYIEGDGLAWKGRSTPSSDPTPTNPVALRLAAKDSSPNVIYIARPCQYSRGKACDKAYWTGKRFAPEILDAMNSALNDVLKNHNVSGIRLVGFSGGGAVAALLAARRGDVLDLRTVAGNLDHRAHSRVHDVSTLAGSLNPPEQAEKLRNIPQHHFIGGQDKIVPLEIYKSYDAALGPTPCLHHTIVSGVTHDDGWESQWPALQTITPSCN